MDSDYLEYKPRIPMEIKRLKIKYYTHIVFMWILVLGSIGLFLFSIIVKIFRIMSKR